MFRATFLTVLGLLTFFIWTNCSSTVTSPPQGNGSGYSGLVTWENARARCNVVTVDALNYVVKCRAVAIGDDGSEFLAPAIQDGVTLRWLEPRLLSGVDIASVHSLSAEGGLRQTYEVRLVSAGGSKLEIEVDVTDAAHGTRPESDIVYLSYSITAYGIAPEMLSYQPLSTLGELKGIRLLSAVGNKFLGVFRAATSEQNAVFYGRHNLYKDRFQFPLSGITSMCFMGGRSYLAQMSNVYQLDENGLQVYAGSTNPRNSDDLSFRLRTFFYPSYSRIICSNGDIYYLKSDTNVNNDGRILKIPPAGALHVLARNTGVYDGDGGPVTQAGFKNISDIATAAGGTIYVADAGAHVVRKVDAQGIVTTVAGTGFAGSSPEGVAATLAPLNEPSGIDVAQDGSVFILDHGNNRIRKVDCQGRITTVLANYTPGSYHNYGDLMAVGPDGSVYFILGRQIKKVDPSGTVSLVAGNGGMGFNGDGGPAQQAQLYWPYSISIGIDGLLYISDGGAIRRVDSQGLISTIAGIAAEEPPAPGDNVQASTARIPFAHSIAVGIDGSLYLAQNDNRVRRIDSNGTLSTFAGNGVWGDSGDGGSALLAKISSMTIAMGPDNSLYIAANSIRRVTPDGTIETVAGNSTLAGFSGDGGPATSALIAPRLTPSGIAVGRDNSLYIAELDNHRIRKVDANGIINTLAGNGTAGASGDGGLAISASITPFAVAVGWDNAVYVSDTENKRIRKISNGLISSLNIEVDPSQQTVPSDFVLTPGSMAVVRNDLYVIDSGASGMIFLLRPYQDGVENHYLLSPFFGEAQTKDCGGGTIKQTVSALALVQQLRISLSQMCAGIAVGISAVDRCDLGDTFVTLAFSQNLGEGSGSANVMKIVRPCPQ